MTTLARYEEFNPTEYKGTIFRSKLEARWAAFFDFTGLVAAYESEFGEVVSPTGWRINYKPDFYLEKLDLTVEIKSRGIDDLDDLEFDKIAGWARHGDVCLLVGPPRLLGMKTRAHYIFHWNEKERLDVHDCMRWFRCPVCNDVDILDWVHAEICHLGEWDLDLFGNEIDPSDPCRSPKIIEAIKYSKQAPLRPLLKLKPGDYGM